MYIMPQYILTCDLAMLATIALIQSRTPQNMGARPARKTTPAIGIMYCTVLLFSRLSLPPMPVLCQLQVSQTLGSMHAVPVAIAM